MKVHCYTVKYQFVNNQVNIQVNTLTSQALCNKAAEHFGNG